jgi:hypothetical protein
MLPRPRRAVRPAARPTDRLMKSFLLLSLSWAVPLLAQSSTGELRFKVTDPTGLGMQSSVELTSQANQYHQVLVTDAAGRLVAKGLRFGMYRVEVQRQGFAPLSELLEVRTAIPVEHHLTLSLAGMSTAVVVSDTETLIDPHRTGTINHLDSDTLQHRSASRPGRSVINLVNSQPGWLLEANGGLHPRGSENQTQYVVDGIPLTDNRSPAFAPGFEADGVQSMTVLTANYPAEYGRKLGGVIEVVTIGDSREGFHGEAVASGGSFSTAQGHLNVQYGWGRSLLGVSADGGRTDRYLDPPVPGNFTNKATTASFAAHYESDLTDQDRLGVIVRHGLAKFLVPNEQVQQAAGQRQDRDSQETMGIVSYRHTFSSSVLGDFRGMVRNVSASLRSNELATPIAAAQARGFREGYVKGSLSVHQGSHELKAGVEADFGSIRERFDYVLADPARFDPSTPLAFSFSGRAPDREQAAFVQDLVRLGRWTLSAGLRWDHYHLVVDERAVSPRLGVARFWPGANLVLHASYDRAFQTPAFENILLSSAPLVDSLNAKIVRLPVPPSYGDYYEVGLTKSLFGRIKLDANYFRRDVRNFADDDVLLNTGVSFPISFSRAAINGSEVKLEIPRWGRLSGFLSYSYMFGYGYLPVTGGLLLGSEAQGVLDSTDRFRITQDQRHTLSTRFRYQVVPWLWMTVGGSYGSGLPTEFEGDVQDALAQYGAEIVDRVDLERGRVRPSFSLDASLGADLWKPKDRTLRVQVDGQNLTNRLNVINFAGLFSGTALAPPRSFAVRLQADF